MIERSDQDGANWRRAKGEMAMNGTYCRPEPGVLAAYVEGRADDEEVRQVEAWLVSDPDAPDTLIALRTAQDHSPEVEAVPAAIIARAQAIVRAPAGETRTARAPWRLPPGFGLQWSAVAVLMLLVAVAGFEVGRSGGAALNEAPDYVGLSAELGDPDDLSL